MDTILQICDDHILTPYVYPGEWEETSMTRQFLSLLVISCLSAYLLYFVSAGLSFIFVFDKRLMKHPLFVKNQIAKEIWMTCKAVPGMGILSTPFFLLEVRGFSKLYSSFDESTLGWLALPLSMIAFILFTDCLIYWIHRWLHSRWAYKNLHKPHHIWKVPSPFASHAFHPMDGFLQSLPYHIYVFIFPMHKFLYLGMFTFVNFWSVSIHDGDFRVPGILRPIVNGSAHHTDHHMYYNYNYGQFFTLWDRIGGSFRNPSGFEGNSPLDQVLKASQEGCKKGREEQRKRRLHVTK